MNRFTKAVLIAAMVLGGVSAVSAQISVGIQIGPPPPPRVVRVVPDRPGADFMWVEGYWYPVGNHYKWHPGYWSRPPYEGAHWVAPHHDGERFYNGYWEGEHGRVEHDHHSDRDHDRDFRDHDKDKKDKDDRKHDRDDRDHFRDDHDR